MIKEKKKIRKKKNKDRKLRRNKKKKRKKRKKKERKENTESRESQEQFSWESLLLSLSLVNFKNRGKRGNATKSQRFTSENEELM